MDKYVIIVAGGKGKRMEAEIPKQFLQIAGRPVLMHTLQNIYNFDNALQIILVLPEPFIDFWKSLCKRFDFAIPHLVIKGGDTRFESVKCGLHEVRSDGMVGIHDGVRPLVSHATLHNVFNEAEKFGNAVPVVKVNESMRHISANSSIPVKRQDYRMIQTPQCFHSKLIKKAYEQKYREDFTDDATVVEALGEVIHLVDGNYENIKITRPGDLKFAEAYLK
ncbi:MAG: 2-C-methyl-D-erythritol 4-phosphate cytidylyltransferase [Bacteroidetes bacterium]|nr:2-C-methyl-D-erythritol 4-phosphate cytidylyltransferase [Bacteroidota bacterium]